MRIFSHPVLGRRRRRRRTGRQDEQEERNNKEKADEERRRGKKEVLKVKEEEQNQLICPSVGSLYTNGCVTLHFIPVYTKPGRSFGMNKLLLLRIYSLNYAAVMSQLYGAVMPCGVLQTHNPTTHPWTINSILKVPT